MQRRQLVFGSCHRLHELLRGHIFSFRFDFTDGLLGLLRGPICGVGRRLLDLQRRNLLGDFRNIELLQLRARIEFRRWIERLFRLFGWHLPSSDGRIELLELLRGDIFCARGECLLELRRWDFPGIHRDFKLRTVCSGDGLELSWCFSVEHLRVVFGGFVLFNYDIFRVRCVRCREFCA